MFADRNPDRIAVVDGAHEISYGALDARSNRLAHYLINLGIGPGSVACTHLPPGLDLMVAILAIAKTGGAFLTIDPQLPIARKRLMIGECEPRVTISPVNGDWGADGNAAMVDLDRDSSAIGSQTTARPESRIVEGSLAYLFYTSGSSGDPKAVMVPWNTQAPPGGTIPCPGEDDRHVLKSSPAFTLIVREIFQPITSGGRVYLLPKGRNGDPDVLLDSIITNNISLITIVPSVLRVLLTNPKLPRCLSLRFIDCIGESLSPGLRIAFQAKLPVSLGVTYGCTEASSATSRVFDPDDNCDYVDLGKPLSGRSIYILDQYLNRVAEGGSGQIYVGGKLSMGYFKRPRLTAEHFIPDPYSPIPGARMYCTGDHGRLSTDGSLIYLGRGDDQVQISGQRVEPAEVEKAIASHDLVEQVVVMTCGTPAQPYLVAFVTSRAAGLTVPILNQFIRSRLPRYMVPARFKLLASLPLLPGGKLDRGGLRDSLADSKHLRVGPANDTEEKIHRIWSEMFGHSEFGVVDDFFELGADSLMAAQLIHHINDTFREFILAEHLTEQATVRSIAAAMNLGQAGNPSNVVRINKSGKKAPFIAVHGEGNIFFYGRLAKFLGSNRPFYAIQASGLDGTPIPYQNLPDCAADYVRQIRHFQPAGPYFIGGYCFGGVIAFEMARQLHGAGQSVPLLVIFDNGSADTLIPAGKDNRISAETPAILSYVRAHYEKMVRQYHPEPYPGRAVLIQSATLREDIADRPALKRILDMVSGGYEIYRIEDRDCSIFEDPCVNDVAKIVDESLTVFGKTRGTRQQSGEATDR